MASLDASLAANRAPRAKEKDKEMKNPWFIAAMLLGGMAFGQFANADDGEGAVAPQPEAEKSSVSDGYIDDRSAVSRANVMKYHPAPFHALGRRGRRAAATHQWNMTQAEGLPWHGQYYNAQYGAPVALVVPPTAAYISNYGWGVGNTTSTPIYHQYARPYPGQASGTKGGTFHATPLRPSDTQQYGFYPVRGPW